MSLPNQIIVVGGGLAGLSAAHTILEHGGNVLVLDKNPFFGGNSTKATSGINGALTKTQVALGIPDSDELFYQDTAHSARDLLVPELARVLTGNSASAVEWLQTKFNLDLSLVSRLGGHSQPRTHRGKEKFPGMTITYALMEALEDAAQAMPHRVKIIKRARVTRLIKDNQGNVTGVEYRVVNKDNSLGETHTEPGPVILATGGYAADFSESSLLKQYRPELYDLSTTNGDHCTGDGIKMSMAIGGKATHLEKVQVHPTGLIDPKEPDAKVKFLAAEALRGCGGLLLNANGERFCDELGHRDYVTGMMWKNKFPIRLVLNTAAAKEIEWHCKHYVGRGLMRRFANGEELAKEIGVPPEQLKRTFDEYNAIARGEKKDPWGKKYFHNVPISMQDDFHVALMQPVLHYTMGGVEITPNAEIVDTTGKSIPGLYACGEMAGGVHGANRLGGSSLLGCVVFGRVAGNSASRYLMSRLVSGQGAAAVGGQSAQQRLANIAQQMGGNAPLSASVSGGAETRVHIDPQSRRVHMEVTWNDASNPTQQTIVTGAPPQQQQYHPAQSTPSSAEGSSTGAGSPPAAEQRQDQNRPITAEEVAKHTSEDDCWVIINGKVLDVTKFLPDHPGGKRAIMIYAGRDASEEFNMLHKPDVIEKYAPESIIGTLGQGGASGEKGGQPQKQGWPHPTNPKGGQVERRGPTIMTMTPSDTESLTSGGTASVLKKEREGATFEVEKLTNILDGGPEKTKRRRFILSPIKNSTAAGKHDHDRETLIAEHIRHFIKVHEMFWESFKPTREEIAWMSEASLFQGTLMNHYGLFLYTIETMGNDEQKKWFLQRAREMKIVGSYAQTELGHGSNVRGLMTTAVYDKSTQEFIVNTPTLRAIKWWPGTLGKVATHAAVYAQLIIDGKEYGVHPFIVQIRDEQHRPLPGIELGDLGPKLGDHANDTGYMVMKDVRIPRMFLLARYQEVTPEGKYIVHPAKKQNAQVHYATMITTRASMVKSASGHLAKCVTIAVRYSAVRTQGYAEPGRGNRSYKDREMKVIDYQVQRFRLFKQLALCYAMKFTGGWMMQVMAGMEAGNERNLEALPELAATSSGLKALCTYLAWQGIEDVRKCCGGNGYLMDSGIAPLAADYVWQITAEGDWIILMLQTARFLIQSVGKVLQGGKVGGVAAYIANIGRDAPQPATKPEAFMDLAYLQDLFEYGALSQIREAAERFQATMEESKGQLYEAINENAIQMVAAVRSHTYFFFLNNFVTTINGISDVRIRAVLTRVCGFFAVSHILEDSLWTGLLDATQTQLVKAAAKRLMNDMRPDAVPLVDAFDFPDNVLNSTIGRYDGNVYEALYEAAAKSRLNRTDPFDGYEETLRPYLDLEFLKRGNQVPEGSASGGSVPVGVKNTSAKI
ncbi:uncharacterized protein VTP21DRAFT_9319 [Calcarisporiella thermophila]|uniref:uncharacterized protein n=1 Tax=Calcarisporiella thermophila TaxID=911321 RepID=UPI00374370F4